MFRRSVGPLAVPSFGAVERNRRKPGGSGSGQARSSEEGMRSSGAAQALAKPACLLCRERHDRPPRGATAALNRTGAGSDRNETEGRNGQGGTSDAEAERKPSKTCASPAGSAHPAVAFPAITGAGRHRWLAAPFDQTLPGRGARARSDAMAASCRASFRESASISGWRSAVMAARLVR